MILHTRLAAAAVVMASAGSLAAQTSRELAEKHPAAQVVVQFLRHSVNRSYGAASSLVSPQSLATLKKDYVERLMSPRIPLDQVGAMCRAVGVEKEEQVQAMTPAQFYVAYNQGMQRRYNVTDADNKRIAESLQLFLLSVAEEGKDLVHLLVRTKHETANNEVSNLEVVSLVLQEGKWRVSLGAQETKYTPLEKKEGGAKAATPATR